MIQSSLLNWYSGTFVIYNDQPAVTIERNVVYMPVSNKSRIDLDKKWGLYDENGNLIPGAAHKRGPGHVLFGQTERQDLSDVKKEDAPSGHYIYGGVAVVHYGHFLLSTLSRFWVDSRIPLKNFKIVCQGTDISYWFSLPHVRDVFHALGLSEENFISFDKPTVIGEIIIPHQSCQERDFGYQCFAELGNKIGENLTQKLDYRLPTTPVYFSKHRLHSGVQRFSNEEDMCHYLEKRGVQILFPEEMSLAEQVLVYKNAPVVMACLGSTLHTSILCQSSARIVCVTAEKTINSNFGIIDTINGNDSIYLQAPYVEVDYSERAHFLRQFQFINPIEVAETMLRAAEKINDTPILMKYNEDSNQRSYAQSMHQITFYRRRRLIELSRESEAHIQHFIIEPYIEIDRDSTFVPLTLFAHISKIGDTECNSGWIRPRELGRKFEGFSLQLPSGSDIEIWYRARLMNCLWTEWSSKGAFVGTRGKHEHITGVAVRVGEQTRLNFWLELIVETTHGIEVISCPEGGGMSVPNEEGILGMQVILRALTS